MTESLASCKGGKGDLVRQTLFSMGGVDGVIPRWPYHHPPLPKVLVSFGYDWSGPIAREQGRETESHPQV